MCRKCRGTGLTYEGTGHRMGYPFRERNTATECTCPAGDALVKERKDAAARRIVESDETEDYIMQKRQEMRDAETARNIALNIRFCPKCQCDKDADGFSGFDICGDCLAACHVKETTQ